MGFNAVLLLLPSLAIAQVRITENNVTRTVPCAGQQVSLEGNDGTFTLKGECSGVKVLGNRNKVAIEASKAIDVLGNDNRVSWASGAPKVAVLGQRNEAGPSGAAAAVAPNPAEPIRLQTNQVERTIECQGHTVSLEANETKVTLKGPCKVVKVLGNRNQVRIESAGEIVLLGNQNTVSYEHGPDAGVEPVRSLLGKKNSLSKLPPGR